MKLAWIGTGVMGKAMLLHLHKAGHQLYVYNRTYEKAMDLTTKGIQVCNSIRECVKDVDVVFTMVGYPQDVADIYRREDGIFHNVKKKTVLIDMTTSSPTLAVELYREAKQLQFDMLDAPVSGGDRGAKEASLSIMVGGEKEVFTQCTSLFACLGTTINYMGKAGSGQHTKACNQIAVAGATAAMSEAILYAQQVGIDPQAMLAAIGKGAGGSWQIEHSAPKVLVKDDAPGFYIKHFIKDMHIIQEEMQKKGIQLQMLDTIAHMYETLAMQGEENNGTQALVHYYHK